MEHVAVVVAKKQLSNGQVSVQLRCCNDDTTRCWHTLTVTGNTSGEDISAWLNARKTDVQNQHAAMQHANDHLNGLL